MMDGWKEGNNGGSVVVGWKQVSESVSLKFSV